MSEELATLFEGKEIRAIEQNGDLWIPLADIAAAWGIDRSTPDNMIVRNPEVFAGLVSTVLDAVSTPMQCINERGLYLMMGKITTGRVKNKSAREAIIRFQRWFPELIQKFRKGEITQVPQKADIRTELLQAKEYADICGKAPESFQAKVFQKHGMPEFADALQPPVPALVHGSTGWFIPTQLGQMCGLTAEQFNHWLHNNPNDPERRPFQCRDPENRKVWRLTELGWLHGQEYWFEAPSGHREIRIRWRESILYASGLKREIPASQLMLPARA